MARARVVAVLNAAIRMAWVMSSVWVSRTCWPGLTWPSGSRVGMARWVSWALSRSASAARRSAVSWSASVAARARSYLALAARTLVWAFFLAGLGTIRVGSSSVVA